MGLAHLGLVTLRPGFAGLIVPSKLPGYMARGIPVLYIGPRSDISIYLERYSCGVSFGNQDAAGVASAIVALHADRDRLSRLGENGKRSYDAELAKIHGLARYESMIRSVLSGAGSLE